MSDIELSPATVVFKAEIIQTDTNPTFAQFTWSNALQGTYTDVMVGQTVFITATDHPSELHNPLFRGRVRIVPTATEFFINECALILRVGYIVTVINSYDVWQRVDDPKQRQE